MFLAMTFLQSLYTYFMQLGSLTVTVSPLPTLALGAWLQAFIVGLGLLTIFYVVQHMLLYRLRAFAARTDFALDDVVVDAIASIRHWVVILVVSYITMQFFAIPNQVDVVARALVLAALLWQAIEIAMHFLRFGTQRLIEKSDGRDDHMVDPAAATAADMVTLIARIALWTLGGLFVLSNLGIEVTSLIAGLGIGGIAVAFALQGVLSDLFASFSIYFDKPFRIGDFVIIGADSGTVEKIGIKSTRIRTLQGQELVISNAELTTARVQNFKKMKERRIVVTFGITYETPVPLIEAVPEMVRNIFSDIEHARLDRVHFTTLASSALEYEVVYFVDSADYVDYLAAQQQFNLTLMRKFAAEGIDFAYPTQTIFTKAV